MKKIPLLILVITLFTANIFAMPGFESFIQDNSGEYVYYKDNTFTRESYIGILYYDDSTLQLRYAAPKSKKDNLPEKQIALLVSIDPEKDYLEMTGERILTTILPNKEDTDIVNYLHDILYEFHSRRSKEEVISKRDYSVSQDYPQFGDNVSITYDASVPIFNIKEIINGNGEKVFQLATFGQLTSSQDQSFDKFYGFPEESSTISTNLNILPQIKSKKNKGLKNHKVHYDKQTLVLDENWEQKMENFWLLGDDSMITLSQIPAMTQDRIKNEIFLLRKFFQSRDYSYVDLLSAEISYAERKYQYKLTSRVFQSDSETYVWTVKLLTSLQPKKGFIAENSTAFNYFAISTYQQAYEENPAYFDKIVKNYKSN
ncbi:MAG: hypothetical protein K5866_09320 [Treponema sp.]|nr:hypothetical protein [Treponema sp.]